MIVIDSESWVWTAVPGYEIRTTIVAPPVPFLPSFQA
jgi:hypothetical protein